VNKIDLRTLAIRSAGLTSLDPQTITYGQLDIWMSDEINRLKVELLLAGNDQVATIKTYDLTAGEAEYNLTLYNFLALRDLFIKWSAAGNYVRAIRLDYPEFVHRTSDASPLFSPSTYEPAWAIPGNSMALVDYATDYCAVVPSVIINPVPGSAVVDGLRITGVKPVTLVGQSNETIIMVPAPFIDRLVDRIANRILQAIGKGKPNESA